MLSLRAQIQTESVLKYVIPNISRNIFGGSEEFWILVTKYSSIKSLIFGEKSNANLKSSLEDTNNQTINCNYIRRDSNIRSYVVDDSDCSDLKKFVCESGRGASEICSANAECVTHDNASSLIKQFYCVCNKGFKGKIFFVVKTIQIET
ncbi:unnamed protein product [Gordionus sp. m RMFG-2023]